MWESCDFYHIKSIPTETNTARCFWLLRKNGNGDTQTRTLSPGLKHKYLDIVIQESHSATRLMKPLHIIRPMRHSDRTSQPYLDEQIVVLCLVIIYCIIMLCFVSLCVMLYQVESHVVLCCVMSGWAEPCCITSCHIMSS